MNPHSPFLEQIRDVQQQLFTDLSHRLFSGVEVLRALRQQQADASVLMPVVFTSTLGLSHTAPRNGSLFGRPGYVITQTPQVWIDCQVLEQDGGLVINWDTVEQLFEPALLDGMFNTFEQTLAALADSATLWDSPLLLPLPLREQQLWQTLNATEQPWPDEGTATLLTGFLTQTRRQPDHPALIADDQTLTYQILLDQATNLACTLLHEGVTLGAPVVLLLDKGIEQITAVLATGLAGACYVPLNNQWPAGRVEQVIQQLDTPFILTTTDKQAVFVDLLPDERILCVDENSRQPSYDNATVTRPLGSPDDLAYILFTSGSTGTPKGVMMSHRAALNTIQDINRRFDLTPQDRVYGLSALSFDLSVWDIFGALSAGATLVLPDSCLPQAPRHWRKQINEHGVTVWNTVPALAGLLTEDQEPGSLPSLRLALLSGDWIPLSLPNQLRAVSPDCEVIALGGATEAAIWSNCYPAKTVDSSWSSIPYGTPLANQQFYVLHPETLTLCPVGVTGELCIGGEGLAQGYLGDKEKTAAAFIDHPDFGRLYRTGDLGHLDRAGYLVFEGREDTQVKLHGHRVELGEIENALVQLPWIEEAAVTFPQQTLVGYIVPDPARLPGTDQRHGQTALVDPAERLTFKLSQPGPVPVKDTDTVIPLPLDKTDDNFTLSSHWMADDAHRPQPLTKPLTLETLGQLLAGLRRFDDGQAPLPKYGYPSAGSLYPVRLVLHVGAKMVEGLPEGRYAYHPDHQLLPLDDEACAPGALTLELVAWLPAIQPMYGELALTFCRLEAGAMVAQLAACASVLGMGLQSATLADKASEKNPDTVPLVQITLTAQKKPDKTHIRQYALRQRRSYRRFQHQVPDSATLATWLATPTLWASQQRLHIAVLLKADSQNNGWQWQNDPGDPVSERITDQLLLWPDSSVALVITGDQAGEDALLAAGHLGQQLQLTATDHNMGLCPLGTWSEPEHNGRPVLYALIGGQVAPDAWKTPGEQQPDLQKVINYQLRRQLPDYMVPQIYVSLDTLPLTANGKIDRKALPVPELVSTTEYVAPTSATEIRLCTLWQTLLQQERVGLHDNFFSLGGDSLLAIRLTQQISQEMGVELPVARLFQHPTIAELAQTLTTELSPIPARDLTRGPLSFAQQRLWFIEQFEQGTAAYHIPVLLPLDSEEHGQHLLTALQLLAHRHHTLRTLIRDDGTGQPRQIISGKPLTVQKTTVTTTERGEALNRILTTPFDLTQEYPLRVVWLTETGASSTSDLLVLVFHHIAVDGWSLEVLFRECLQLTEALTVAPETAPHVLVNQVLPPLTINYLDVTLWQREQWRDEQLERQTAWWQQQLADLEPLTLPLDYPRPPRFDYQGKQCLFTLPAPLSSSLRALASQQKTTLYTVMLSALALLLGRYCGQDDIAVGSPIANRHHPQLEPLVGFFANTTVIRTTIDHDLSVTELVDQSHRTITAVQQYQDIPFEQLVDQLDIERDPSRHPLFQVMFAVQRFDLPALTGHTLPLPEKALRAKFDLTLMIDDSQAALRAQLEYPTALFKQTTMAQLWQHYVQVLAQMVENPGQKLRDIGLLTDDEYQQIVVDWNQTDAPLPPDDQNLLLHHLFERQVIQAPDDICLIFEGEQLTNREVSNWAQSAGQPRFRSVSNSTLHGGDPAGNLCGTLFSEPRPAANIAALAILKAGCVYVTIRTIPKPLDRIRFILQDTKAASGTDHIRQP